jgi:hypothetical protein
MSYFAMDYILATTQGSDSTDTMARWGSGDTT